MSLKAKLAKKWGLPPESAIKIEALSYNLNLFTDKEDVEREIAEFLVREVSPVMIPLLKEQILNTSPFKEFGNNRYEIHVYYVIKDRDNVIDRVRGYYNYYCTREEAINKYEQKLSLLREDPAYYEPYCGCGYELHRAEIYLVDTFVNKPIEWKAICINNN